jgi:hypothetical protein
MRVITLVGERLEHAERDVDHGHVEQRDVAGQRAGPERLCRVDRN